RCARGHSTLARSSRDAEQRRTRVAVEAVGAVRLRGRRRGVAGVLLRIACHAKLCRAVRRRAAGTWAADSAYAAVPTVPTRRGARLRAARTSDVPRGANRQCAVYVPGG